MDVTYGMMIRSCLLALLAAATAMGAVSLEKLPPHPRLFADAARFSGLKKEMEDHQELRDFHQVLRNRAEQLLKQEPVVRTMTGKRLLQVSRDALGCITVSAMAGKLDGNPAYKERAIREMKALAGFTDWNPSHFLDVAEATFAMGIGYDWLHDDMSPQDRDLIATAIIDKGLKASLPKDGQRNPGWVRMTNNWNQVCHSGMTIGALAVAERAPELATLVVDRAIANLKFSAGAYAPDGVYPEGPGYWSYGTSFHVSLVDALRTSLGDTYDLEKFPGFLKTADYIVQMESPAGKFYNYSDNGESRGFQTPLFWFARELKRPDLLASDLKILGRLKAKPGKLDRMMPLALIWWDTAAGNQESTPPSSWAGDGKVPLAVFRQEWGNPNASFVAVKGGKPDLSHAHMDVGSFIVECDGVRWAEDTGAQSYFSLESRGINLWNYLQDSPRWQVFRFGPESHNIIRFNGTGQLVKGSAKVLKADTANRLTLLDLTDLYATEVQSVRRGVRMMDDGGVLIRDEWQAGDKPAAATFQWLTKAAVTADKNGAILRAGEKTLHLKFTSGSPLSVTVDDLSAPMHDYDIANPRLKRIRVEVQTSAGNAGHLLVAATRNGNQTPDPGPLDKW